MMTPMDPLLFLYHTVAYCKYASVVRNHRLATPEVSEVKTMAEDVVDLTVKAEEPEVEETATVELQQQQAAVEEEAAELTVTKAEEKVGEAPKFLVKPEPKAVEEGQTVVFECDLSGEPMPEVQ